VTPTDTYLKDIVDAHLQQLKKCPILFLQLVYLLNYSLIDGDCDPKTNDREWSWRVCKDRDTNSPWSWFVFYSVKLQNTKLIASIRYLIVIDPKFLYDHSDRVMIVRDRYASIVIVTYVLKLNVREIFL
jgi:hypothetical protein